MPGETNQAEERSAAAKAQMVLSTLTTATPRTDEIVHKLRYAAGLADAASEQGFSSDEALNVKRAGANTAFKSVVGLLEKGQLTQDLIDRAKTAVADWLKALDDQRA